MRRHLPHLREGYKGKMGLELHLRVQSGKVELPQSLGWWNLLGQASE